MKLNRELEIALKRGFKVDRDSTIEKLKEELKELEESADSQSYLLDSLFYKDKTVEEVAQRFFMNKPLKGEEQYNADFYESFFKDTEIGELGDIIKVCKTRLQELDIDVDNLMEVIDLYNERR